MLPVGFLLSVAFMAGVVLAGTDRLTPVYVFIAATIAVLVVLTGRRYVAVVGALFLVAMMLGSLRGSNEPALATADPELSRASRFTGKVLDVPRNYPSATFSRLEITEPAPATVWGELPPYPRVVQGDILTIQGGFRGFDERAFGGLAAQRGVQGVLYAERVDREDNRATFSQQLRNDVSGEVTRRLRSRVPEPAGAFATGIVLGDDGAMTEATRDAFRVGGLTHMTAVSGIHVGIVAGALLLLSRMGLIHRWWLMAASFPAIWTFAYLVGMRPSVVRASLMLTLFLLAQFLGRPRDTLNAVGIASALMVLIDPGVRYDIGYQLSVAATTGIALGVLVLGNRSRWHVVWVVPLAAEVATTPLILYHFGYYSLASPLANIVATPFLAVAMVMSILTVLVSFGSGMLADALALGAWVPSIAVVTIADIASTLPGMTGDIEPLSTNGVWAAYTLLGALTAILFVVLRPVSSATEGDLDMAYRV